MKTTIKASFWDKTNLMFRSAESYQTGFCYKLLFHNKHQSAAIHLSDTIYHCFCDKHWSKIKGAAQTRGGGGFVHLCPLPSAFLSLWSLLCTLSCSQGPLVRSRLMSVSHSRVSMAPVAMTTQMASLASARLVSKDTSVNSTSTSAKCSHVKMGLHAWMEWTGVKSFLSGYFNGKKSIFYDIFLVSATAVTALAQPSQARTARRRCRRVTLDPASIAPPVRTTRVTTPVCAGQVRFRL